MKKIISFLLCSIITFTFSFSATAKESAAGNTVTEKQVIEFIHEDDISEDLKTKIENHILNGECNESRGIGCVLFGHDLITTTTTKITHKVNSSAPRCREEIYKVETCEDCDYTKSTLIATNYINCCS